MKISQKSMGIDTENVSLNTGTNAEKKTNSNYSREKIDDSPFEIIEEEGKGAFIAMGNFALTTPKETKEQAIDEMETWNFAVNVISAVVEMTEKVKQIKAIQEQKTINN